MYVRNVVEKSLSANDERMVKRDLDYSIGCLRIQSWKYVNE